MARHGGEGIIAFTEIFVEVMRQKQSETSANTLINELNTFDFPFFVKGSSSN